MSVPSPADHPAPHAAAVRNSRQRWYLSAGIATVVAAGAMAWWFASRPEPPVDVPMPPDIGDPEVLAAVEAARKEVLGKPASAEAWGTLGMVLEAHLYEAEADRCFERAEHLAPDDVRWPYLRGMYAMKYDPGRALPLLRRATEARGASPGTRSAVRLRLAEVLLERRVLGEAEEIFREEWEQHPGNPRAGFGLALVALARDGRDRAAVPYLEAARHSPAARKAATASLAALARARGNTEVATRYEQELPAMPADVGWPDPVVDQILGLKVGADARVQEAARLEREGRFGEAAQLYLRRIDANGSTAKDCLGAGLNLVRAREYERGLDLLRQAVALAPGGAQTHVTLALCLLTRAERELAAGAGRERVRVWLEEAVAHAKEAARLRPDLARAYMAWGLGLKHLGKPAEAVPPLRRGVACLPADFELQLALGEALLEAHDPAGAREPLGNARQLEPDDPRLKVALERLAKAGD
jgi:tetratricopeptide (TPR) repeat protein